MGFILSCSTIPSRINYLIQIIPLIKARYKYFIINICSEYKRFGKFKIPKSLLLLCKKDKRVVFNFMDDNGPLNKYIGGFNFIKKKKLYDDKLIIIDDDTVYSKDLFYSLLNEKSNNNITTGSGFDYNKDRSYKIVYGACDMVEGYAGVCFDYNQVSDFILWYSKFYKLIDFKRKDDLINSYLTASFLGDDFIISSCYKDKWAIDDGRKLIAPQGYGFNNDALHKNNVFGSNMGSYKYLYDNIKVLDTFKNKFILLSELQKIHNHP
jgi:hypothetical protein